MKFLANSSAIFVSDGKERERERPVLDVSFTSLAVGAVVEAAVGAVVEAAVGAAVVCSVAKVRASEATPSSFATSFSASFLVSRYPLYLRKIALNWFHSIHLSNVPVAMIAWPFRLFAA